MALQSRGVPTGFLFFRMKRFNQLFSSCLLNVPPLNTVESPVEIWSNQGFSPAGNRARTGFPLTQPPFVLGFLRILCAAFSSACPRPPLERRADRKSLHASGGRGRANAAVSPGCAPPACPSSARGIFSLPAGCAVRRTVPPGRDLRHLAGSLIYRVAFEPTVLILLLLADSTSANGRRHPVVRTA